MREQDHEHGAPPAGAFVPDRDPRPDHDRPTRWRGAVAAVLAAAAVVRLAFLASPLGRLDADEAVTGLMARRILAGDLPLHFAGQRYMGALEQYVQALVLAVAPDTGFWLRLPQVALAVATCWLIWRIGLRALGGPPRAIVAAAVFAVGPYQNLLWSTRSRGAYASGTLLAAAGVLLALRADDPEAEEGRNAAAFGVCCGLAFWQLWQAAYLLVPAGWWLLGSLRRRPRGTALAAAGFALGAAPVLLALAAGRGLEIAGVHPPSTLAERAARLLDPVLALFVGARPSADAAWGPWLPPALVAPVLVGVLAAAAATRWEGLRDAVLLRRGARRPGDLLLLAALLAPLPYLASPASWFAGSAGYLQVLQVALALGLAALVPRTGWQQLAGGVAVVGLVAAGTAATAARVLRGGGGGEPSGAVIVDGVLHGGVRVDEADLRAVADVLRARGDRAAYADYWLAYPLAWAAGESVTVVPVGSRRFADDAARAARDPSPAFVVAPGPPLEQLREALAARGATWEEAPAGPLVVVDRVQPGLHPHPTGDLPREWGLAP